MGNKWIRVHISKSSLTLLKEVKETKAIQKLIIFLTFLSNEYDAEVYTHL